MRPYLAYHQFRHFALDQRAHNLARQAEWDEENEESRPFFFGTVRNSFGFTYFAVSSSQSYFETAKLAAIRSPLPVEALGAGYPLSCGGICQARLRAFARPAPPAGPLLSANGPPQKAFASLPKQGFYAAPG